ncbi:MAG: hypothetical protein OXB89_08550 [Anaerolineaceae bacterium]|nr:hypothetical protein [Anaerolineaceae bacterium]
MPFLVELWLEKMALLQLSDGRVKLTPDAADQRMAAMESWIRDSDYCLLVATTEKQTEGYIVGCERMSPPGLLPLRQGHVLEMTLAIHSELNGLGGRLWPALKDWFNGRGLGVAIVHVSSRLPVEQAFWRSLSASEMTDSFWLRT